MNEHKKEKGLGSGGWRYQAVYKDDVYENHTFSICEVYLDEAGKLEAWTENSAISPYGETLDELTRDLHYMLNDISKWKPISVNSLHVGIVFERIDVGKEN